MNYSRTDIERKYLAYESNKLFNSVIKDLNLEFNLKYIGHFPYTTTCVFFNSEGKIVDVGNGKGIGSQSEISAKFEALEHYLSTSKDNLKNECLIFSFKEIERQLSESNKKLLPKNLLSEDNVAKQTSWIKFASTLNDSHLMLPYFLINPDYIEAPFSFDKLDYSKIPKKVTNNGTAIGASFDEAIIHAINELLERDAISCLLLSSFAKDKPNKIRIIKHESLPKDLFYLVNKLEEDYDEKILIIDITTPLDFPVYCAALTKQNQSIQPLGFGASFFKSYAIERAVLEALQVLHLYDNMLRNDDNVILERFKYWPALKRCAQCNFLPLIKANLYDESEFYETETIFDSLETLLSTTLRLLSNHNFEVFYAINYASPTGVTCVRAVIPGLEQFHQVRNGHFILPNERGIKILQEA